MRIVRGLTPARDALSRSAPAGLGGDEDRERLVRGIVDDVARRGDAALLEYTERFDGVAPARWEVASEQLAAARKSLDPALATTLEMVAERIRDFHAGQKQSLGEGQDVPIGWRFRPIDRVGVYAPGGTATLPSSLLMTAIPARVAGVGEVILATPPGSDGLPSPIMMAAAAIARVDRVFAVGGAQAIAALAFGTESVPRVDKICGPGNIYVMLAKKLLYGIVGIDGLYGPSEVLIIADERADPANCAADLLAQAEHDALAAAILVTTSPELAEKVDAEVTRQLAELPRREIAAESLDGNGIIAVVTDCAEAITLANAYAPEHLLLMVADPAAYLDRLTATGCIITGDRATVAIGDYVAGPSHVLPTGGTARFGSPLNVTDFMKITNVVTIDGAAIAELGPTAAALAETEGLDGHARAVRRRQPPASGK
ncbi:MAG: histidinol dehydrogenase [Dehalococcoidales bacterium]